MPTTHPESSAKAWLSHAVGVLSSCHPTPGPFQFPSQRPQLNRTRVLMVRVCLDVSYNYNRFRFCSLFIS